MRARPNTQVGLAAALIATPLLWIAAEFASPALKSTASAQLDVIAANPDRWYWYTVLLAAGTITWVPAVLGVTRVARRGAPTLASIGGVLVAFSAIVAVGDAMTQFMTWQMVKGSANRAPMAALLDRFDNSTASNVFYLAGGIALLVGTGLLTAALARSGARIWVAITFAAGIVINFAGFIANNIALITAGAIVLLPPLTQLARQHLHTPAPEVRPASVSPYAVYGTLQ